MSDDNKRCPFCGSTNLTPNMWCVDDREVDAIECNDCLGGAITSVWNGTRSLFGGEWLTLAEATPNPDQNVLKIYVKEDNSLSEPIISVVTSSNGAHIYKGRYMYRPVAFWMPIAPLPKLSDLTLGSGDALN